MGLQTMTRRRKPWIPIDSRFYRVMEYILLVTGSFLIAISFNLFLNPNRIASGGVTGLSTILQEVAGWEPAYVQWALNIPLFIAGVLLLGGRFGLKTALGSIVLPFFVLLTSRVEPWTTDPLLATIFGGVGIGTGLGIVFRGRGSTGGLDLAAQILHRYTGLTLAVAVLILDGLVIMAAGIFLSLENALYAMVGLFVASKMIDVVQTGLNVSKVVYIVSAEHEKISNKILIDMDRGLTRIAGLGGYTGESRPILMVVLGQMEVMRLKTLVREIDSNAFVILSDAREVLGEGFRKEL
jgi:uncharacterized membrane-anchored protein YitT (DUF2179 family)